MKNDLPTLIFWFPENQAMLPGKVAAIFFKGKAGSLELFYRLLLAHFVDGFDRYIRIFSSELYQNQLAARLERF